MDRLYKTKAGVSKFRTHLRRTINADDIDNMTKMVDRELSDSQNAMNQIASIFASMNEFSKSMPMHNLDGDAPSKFLEAEPYKLETKDLVDAKFEGEVDVILASMKKHADDLKKNFSTVEPQAKVNETDLNLEPIDINQYASSLEQLNSRLAYIRQNMKHEETKKDLNMEEKLEILNENVKLLKELTESNTLLSKSCSASSGDVQNGRDVLSQYEEIINKLHAGINDLTYLRQNKG